MLYDRLPFPIYRHIIDYTGTFPKWDVEEYELLKRHFEKKYCRRCGEYINMEKIGKKEPIHIHGRYEKHRYNNEIDYMYHYHYHYLSLYSFCLQLNCRVSHTFRFVLCPLLFYSKQKRHYYQIMNNDEIDIEQMKNMTIVNMFRNDEFSIVYRYKYSLEQYIHDYKKSNICDVILYYMNDELYDEIKTGLSKNSLSYMYYCFYKIFVKNNRVNDFFLIINYDIIFGASKNYVAKILLTKHYDIILENASEDVLNDFIRRNQKWFRRFMKEYPQIFEYITIHQASQMP